MREALRAAQKGGRTSPNPSVGAVLVRGKKVLSRGFHRGPGTLHAEADALKKVGGRAPGATLYVTLEPCCHTEKRTPPCIDGILKSRVRRVVIGVKDPNPRVSGKGIRALIRGGLRVETGCLAEECGELIRAYGKWISTGLPFVLLKAAVTLDGKIATKSGESHWITGDASRRKVHELRAQADAVMVGFQTALKDDPKLTVRLAKGRDPVRIVLDSRLKLPLEKKIFREADKTPTWVATLSSEKKNPKASVLESQGVQVLFCRSNAKGRVDLSDLLLKLGQRGITRILVEGGATLASALVEERAVDEISLFVAPKILGGQALDLFGELRVASLSKAPILEIHEVQPLGEDLWICGAPKK